jgi:hypothetical protein
MDALDVRELSSEKLPEFWVMDTSVFCFSFNVIALFKPVVIQNDELFFPAILKFNEKGISRAIWE